MLGKYIRKKIQERRKAKAMEKIISELKKLLDSGVISQSDYDLAISKLKPEDESADKTQESTDAEQPENTEDTPKSEETDSQPEDEYTETPEEISETEDPAPREEPEPENVPSEAPTESAVAQDQASDPLQQILARLDAIEKKLDGCEQEVDPTKPVGKRDDPTTSKRPLPCDYGPGLRTIYSK